MLVLGYVFNVVGNQGCVVVFVCWFAMFDVCCVLKQGFVSVLGCFVNVVVIVCFSKVACSFCVVFSMLSGIAV